MHAQNHVVKRNWEKGHLQCQTITRPFLTAKEKLHLYIGKMNITGGRALNGLGAERLLNPIKLRMPDNASRESDSVR